MEVKTSVYTPYCLVSYPMRIMPWVSLTLSKKCQALSEKAIQTDGKIGDSSASDVTNFSNTR
jgi:hypothetical protein